MKRWWARASACVGPQQAEARRHRPILERESIVVDKADGLVQVLIETERGAIEIAVDPARAPITTANFLRYVDGGFYDGGRFHRTVTMDNQPNNDVRIEVIQAGVNPSRVDERFGPITLERTTLTGLAHRDGTISMGRFAPD